MAAHEHWNRRREAMRHTRYDVFLMATALLLTLGLLAICGVAQGTSKKEEQPKPPLGPSAAVLESWNDIGRKLIAMAEDFPENKYDFKPNPAERSFAEQLLHAANANYFFVNP